MNVTRLSPPASRTRTAGSRPRGMALLELVMVIGIMALLMQLLMPAVQQSRESARTLQCLGNLRKIGVAMNEHVDVHGHLPSGGWHFDWVGEPERGTGREQPGSWIFNLLDFLEHGDLRRKGHGESGEQRERSLAERCATALAEFHCPLRRRATAYPQTWNRHPKGRDGRLISPLLWGAKSDYAANTGDGPRVEFDWRWQGPATLAEAEQRNDGWPARDEFTGVIFGRSEIRLLQVRDGLSPTYLVGEKFLPQSQYVRGEDFGDNENMYVGFNNDTSRSAYRSPRRDRQNKEALTAWGSAHRGTWSMLYCDGRAAALSFDLDLDVHRAAATRNGAERTGR